MRWCGCGSIAIDANGQRGVGSKDNMNDLLLNGDVMLENIIYYDYSCGNRNIPEDKKDGWLGKWSITPSSNRAYFDRLALEGKVIYKED